MLRTLVVLAHRRSRVLDHCQQRARSLASHDHRQLQDASSTRSDACPWALSCLPAAVSGPLCSTASIQPMHLRHDLRNAGFAFSVAVPAQLRAGSNDSLTRSLANKSPDFPADAHEALGKV
jgi:hypothetical protein